MAKRKHKASKNCRNPKECIASTGPDGQVTFGWGSLSPAGYFEHGCRECAKHYDAGREARIQAMVASGYKRLELEGDYFAWLNRPAWPYATPTTGDE
jgi:hypothetical protein